MNEQINSTESTDVKPCRKCGARERDKSGKCKPCARERGRNWRDANPERFAESVRQWREANPEKVVEGGRKWYASNTERKGKTNRRWAQTNPERRAEITRNWQKTNPEKVKVKDHNRRAKVKGNGGKLSKDIVQLLLIQQSGKCACCGADLSQTGYHLDHIMPLALGGINDDSNVQLLTPTCNLRKGAKHPDKWMPLAS
jgi:5-methylcytosine-specific restriction endonuclease McrA